MIGIFAAVLIIQAVAFGWIWVAFHDLNATLERNHVHSQNAIEALADVNGSHVTTLTAALSRLPKSRKKTGVQSCVK